MSRALFRAGLLLSGLLACARPSSPSEHRVVFELTSRDPEAWSSVLGNIENAQKALGAVKVELVAHGGGLELLVASKNAAVADRLRALAEGGVVFAACQNTMEKQGVTPQMLSPFATPVDSGVAEVVRKQGEGWSYLRTVQ